ncbi:MAG: Ser-Thr-rich GPI-anchored membrane family protein [Bacteroidota bacterium]|nr:Ser-Thr-rich GPI-anchored membrane family protein [Bacteroidota bacterium]MDP4233021.1 Ser-Thr-rich GPI-anchored membrane family protein [Bacteroidota bacterium]MDP4241834.1 Ser-Thr-rich GPI-anchored membrane family protein [Bacteroidota bacterium]MDP4288383.1 Ser-Thr-rich GPI-anchored membrane family protein [Bacteroidota bacterium]
MTKSTYILIFQLALIVPVALAQAQSVFLTPAGGEEIAAGSTQTITWNKDLAKGMLTLSLWDGGHAKWNTIFANVPSEEGHIAWSVPANLAGKRFRIKLSSTDSLHGSGLTRTFFTITQPPPAPHIEKAEKFAKLSAVRVHPNPARDQALICIDEIAAGEPFIAEVVSMTGEHIATLYDATPEADLGLCHRLDCSHLAAGTYFVRIANSTQGRTVKFEVAR